MMIETTPRTGTFAGKTVFTNNHGEGIFTVGSNGSHIQHKGTSQTPVFTSTKQLSAWLHRYFDDRQ